MITFAGMNPNREIDITTYVKPLMDNVILIRKAAGISRSQLSKLSGVPYPALMHLECEYKGSIAKLIQLMQYFTTIGVDCDQLLSGSYDVSQNQSLNIHLPKKKAKQKSSSEKEKDNLLLETLLVC